MIFVASPYHISSCYHLNPYKFKTPTLTMSATNNAANATNAPSSIDSVTSPIEQTTPVAPAPGRFSNLKAIALAAKATVDSSRQDKKEIYVAEQEKKKTAVLARLNSLAEELVRLAYAKAEPAAAKGHGWVKIAEYNLPGYDKVFDPATNEEVMVPRSSPQSTYWAGKDLDPTKNDASPFILLLEGVRREVTKQSGQIYFENRPELLPGGKSAVKIAQGILDNEKADIRLDCRYNSKYKTLIVTAIWIEADWQVMCDKHSWHY